MVTVKKRLRFRRSCVLLAAGLFGIVCGHAGAATINANSPSWADVSNAIHSASSGDTVIIPSGTASWRNQIKVSKAITIQGQTTVNTSSGTATDNTIIVDELARISGGQGFFRLTAPTSGVLRVTGFTFSGVGTSQSVTMDNGIFRVLGSNATVRIDHNHFKSLKTDIIIGIDGPVFGVMDHNLFDNFILATEIARVYMGTYGGYQYGDGSWAVPANYGGSNFWFIEDNYISARHWDHGGEGGVDAAYGGRYVFRYNVMINGTTLGHSTAASGNRTRGVRAQEVYNNTWSLDAGGALDGTTSGSMLVHNNTFSGTAPTGFALQTYRQFWSYGSPFYGADGTRVWDVNDTSDQTGNGYGGSTGGLYASGTWSSVNNGAFTLTDSSANWPVNQWVGSSVSRPSDRLMGLVTANSATVITYLAWQTTSWSAGNSYEIRKVTQILDQIGRGAGTLYTGATPSPNANPNQAQEPCYSWNNVYNPGGTYINFVRNPAALTIQSNRDYYNNTPMPGYTPYVYPHPLTQTNVVVQRYRAFQIN